MGKIRDFEYFFKGKYSKGNNLKVTINFSLKKNKFCAKVPEPIASHSETKEIIADSHEQVEVLMRKFLDEYHMKGIEQYKVIVYQINYCFPYKNILAEFKNVAQAEKNIGNELCSNGSEHLFGVDRDMPNNKLSFGYHVKWLVNVGGNFYLSDEEIENVQELRRADNYKWGNYKNWTQWEHIVYTQELENWFIEMEKQLGALMSRIAMFFGSEPAALLGSIEKSGPAKLIYNPNDKIE